MNTIPRDQSSSDNEKAKEFFLLGLDSFNNNTYEQAEQYFKLALNLAPERLSVLTNLSATLIKLNKINEAKEIASKTLELYPLDIFTLLNYGILLEKSNNFENALLVFENAISISPEFAKAYNNRANVLKELNRFDEALMDYDRAIELMSNFGDAYYNRGLLHLELKHFDHTVADLNRALEFNSSINFIIGLRFHIEMLLCNWINFEVNLNLLISDICNHKKSTPSFPLLALYDSPLTQRKASEIWVNDKFPPNSALGDLSKSLSKPKIKIGYYSADFREHPVSYLTAELFELHDKNSFEIYAFYFGPQEESFIQNRISSAVTQFIDIRRSSDIEVAIISRKMGIDIAVDLTGHTQGGRSGIFSYRAAPIQLSYIGYLGTMGAEYYDYLIGDKVIIPETSQKYYTEKILYLPSYQINDSKREISKKIFTRADFNLPLTGFIFCCFNQSYKITPTTFDVWMDILKATPGSVLFLYSNNTTAENNLKAEAEKRNVNQTRIFFGTTLERKEYLARYKVADLFLDTLPYNAGTTASDALWAGLPVLTCIGESFASRTAASLLTAIGLPELITENYEEYKNLAIELAANHSKLEILKNKLERNLKTSTLFDSPRITKHIENAYTKAYERYQADLQPDHIFIEP